MIDLLAARDGRHEALVRALGAGHAATLFVSLNIPGREKTPPGAEAFFSWVARRVEAEFPAAVRLASSFDALGPCLILGLDGDPRAVKRRCVELESGHPSSRLIDLDVYTPTGAQIDRASLGLAARSCLVCERRAVDCMRAKRHGYDEVIARTHELLAPFLALRT
ncbi:MAG: citrate lyase holo-[acyl-carrier protein] synthase [Candidatus Accumulibacter sp.]|nr:citrate lyase holo-[acyl-carrier protein] synthase [Accumulibacter sp.]